MHKVRFWIKYFILYLLSSVLLSRCTKAQPGSPDASFGGGDGFSTTPFLAGGNASSNAVAIQSNGRIVVAGISWTPDGTYNHSIAVTRFMPNGNLDPTFSGDGKANIGVPNMSAGAGDVLMLPDGKILCVGAAWNGAEELFVLARFNADGTPDNSFDGDGIVTTNVGAGAEGGVAAALQVDGKIVVAGYANLSGYKEFAILRYKPNGALDPAFGGGDGIVTTPAGESYAAAEDVLIQPDGKILAAGYAVANGFEDFALIRYNANGTPDNTFSGDGIAMASFTSKHDQAKSAALQPDGKIVLAGYSGYLSNGAGDQEIAAARFLPNGSLDDTFGDDGLAGFHISNYADVSTAASLQADGKILLGGYSRLNDDPNLLAHFTLVRLTPGGQPDMSFDGDGIVVFPLSPSGDFIHAMALQSDGKAVVCGNAEFDYKQQFAVARFMIGAMVAATAPAALSPQISLYPNPVRENATLEYEAFDYLCFYKSYFFRKNRNEYI